MNMVQNLSTELSEPHLDRLIEAINQLGSSRVLLTGGTGFVGKWLIETAKIACDNGATSFEIVVPTRSLNSKHALETKSIGFKNLSFVEGDILSQTLDFGSIDSIVHAATPASAKLTSENPSEMFRINKVSTESVLKYAHDKMPLLFTSSGAVYGVQPQSVSHIAESIMEPNPPTDELNSYAKGKQVAEKLCLTAGTHDTCAPKIARLFAFSGRYLPRNTHFAIGNFIQNALDRKPILINSDGRSRRSYLYGADMATWLWSALSVSHLEVPLHIGSDHSVSILELAKVVAEASSEILNYTPDIKVADTPKDNDSFHQYVPANNATKQILNVDDWTSLKHGIRLMLANEIN
jgi:dTDP-glucose 4,6-dehydratase